MAGWRRAIKPMFDKQKWKILRGDQVIIRSGKDAGQIGTVTKVIRDEKFPRVLIEGLNLNKRAVKKTQENPGGMVSVESPLAYANVSLIDPVTKAPVKVTWRYLEDGTKVRVTRGNLASGSIIPRPEILGQRRKPRPATLGTSDTTVDVASEQTFTGPGELPTALKEFMKDFGHGSPDAPTRFRYSKRALLMSPPASSDDAGKTSSSR